MLEIKNNTITLTRGDFCALKVDIKEVSGKEYVLQKDDNLVFTMRKKVESPDILLQKRFENGVLNIVSEDTISLDFGAYVYDVVLTLATGEVFTIVPTHTFNVSREVHN